LQETRRALKALRASPLEDLGLMIALRELFESAAERGKLLLEISLPDKELLLSPDVEQCIYRIAQEAVENVVHHANAQHLSAQLTVAGAEIQLVIRDDGIGFKPETHSPAGHFGLKGMQERAQLVGGVLSIDSQPAFTRAETKGPSRAHEACGTTIRLVIKGSTP
jgi:signal transduction histidine kinase